MEALPVKCVMCFGYMCLIFGSLFLACFFSHLIPAFVYTAGFKQVRCTVTSNDYAPVDSCCDLATPEKQSECENVFPCLRVVVAVADGTVKLTNNATLYDSYTTIFYQPQEGRCSHYECGSTYAESKQYTDTFKTKYGSVGSTSDCYYNSDKTQIGLRSKRSDAFFIGTTILSLVLLFAGIVITSYAYWKENRINSGLDIEHRLIDDEKSTLQPGITTGVEPPTTGEKCVDALSPSAPSEPGEETSPKAAKHRKRTTRKSNAEPSASGSGQSDPLHLSPTTVDQEASSDIDEQGSQDGKKHKRKGKKSKAASRDQERYQELPPIRIEQTTEPMTEETFSPEVV